MTNIFGILLVASVVFAIGGSETFRPKRSTDASHAGKFARWLKSIDYDKAQEPEQIDGAPTIVEISILVANIRSISEINMQYSLEMFFREYWRDERLHFDRHDWGNKSRVSLSESAAAYIWQPDTFIPNALSSVHPEQGSISHRALFRLDANGSVSKSSRISIEAECNLDLTRYPFDQQVCKLGVESYGYTTAQLDYFWTAEAALELSRIRLPDFSIHSAFVVKKVSSYATGDYARLYACFVFDRSAGYCFLQLIMPSLAVVFTAWVSMWMDNESSFQDMITIILAIIFLLYSYNESMPKVSYIKAMDIYLGICFAVAFLSLLKIALANYIKKTLECASGARPADVETFERAGKHAVTVRTNRIFNTRFLAVFNKVAQVALFASFLSFCVLFFFVYPFLYVDLRDEDCDASKAVYSVDLSKL